MNKFSIAIVCLLLMPLAFAISPQKIMKRRLQNRRLKHSSTIKLSNLTILYFQLWVAGLTIQIQVSLLTQAVQMFTRFKMTAQCAAPAPNR